MQRLVFVLPVLLTMLLCANSALSSEFNWTNEFNLKAQADQTGFRGQLQTRFQVGGTVIDKLFNQVDHFADIYILLRLGEMCHQPMNQVIEHYHSHKGKGWGVLAKNLGIKPGSKAFHALKQDQDLFTNMKTKKSKKTQSNKKDKGRGKSKGKK